MELAHEQQRGDYYGVGIDENIITASFKALISAANRLGVHAVRLEQAA
jgi:2-isopropylmalate synthase